jgi:hypothetical protein
MKTPVRGRSTFPAPATKFDGQDDLRSNSISAAFVATNNKHGKTRH